MSKLVQRGVLNALRVRSMSTSTSTSEAPKIEKLTPEELQVLEEAGRTINPAQTKFGPKNPNVEKWQEFFQDPIREEKPMYIRKGPADEVMFTGISAVVTGLFLYNIYSFVAK